MKLRKKKEKEEERRRKEIETLGPDPELYADRTEMMDEQSKLKKGKVQNQVNLDSTKLTKEELESKAVAMQIRAENLEKEREERYNTVLAVKESKEEPKLMDGAKPKFVNDIEQKAFVNHSMDLAESINRKKHYNARLNDL